MGYARTYSSASLQSSPATRDSFKKEKGDRKRGGGREENTFTVPSTGPIMSSFASSLCMPITAIYELRGLAHYHIMHIGQQICSSLLQPEVH